MLRFLSRRVFSFAVVLLCASVALGATHGYEALSEWSSLPDAKTGITAGMASSYDRTGGNLDFNHYESPAGYQSEDVDPVTITTITGPGVITRFWMPHACANSAFNVKMYIDGAVNPVIDTDSDTFLGGAYGYFASPLVKTLIGGQVSYEPIVFSESLKIKSNNFKYPGGGSAKKNYYQYCYHKLPAGAAVTPYTGTLTPPQQRKDARDVVESMITNVGQNPAGSSGTATVLTTSAASISAGGSLSLANLATGSGRVRRLNLKMAGASDTSLDGLRLRVRYDGKTENAIDVPVSHFFCAGHERVAYKSLPLGTDGNDGFYCYWPMPFRSGVVVELHNSTGSSIDIDSAVVEYEAEAVASDAGYLHAVYHKETTTAGQQYHQLLNVSGEGHYVGNLLFVQRDGTTGYERWVLEGDDIIIVDGTATLYGTGLEDAYNGGFYYNHVLIQEDDGDVKEPYSGIGPYHGLLRMNFDDDDVGDDTVRTDQYRWLIGDYVPFTDGIEVKIENNNALAGTLFGSTAFYYEVPEPACIVILLVGGIGLLRRRR